MVAPLLFMVVMLGARDGDVATALFYLVLPAFAGLSLVVLIGRLVMRPFFHLVAASGSTEFFMAACLLVVVGAGVLSAIAGLSMGLGAFVAGLLLAETEYRREVEVTIEPFKGLLARSLLRLGRREPRSFARRLVALDDVRPCALHHHRQIRRDLCRRAEPAFAA